MLDNVIDINYYAVQKARDSNLRHRPVGMGIMGFQDCLHMMRVPYASNEAVQFADTSMEAVVTTLIWHRLSWRKNVALTALIKVRCGIGYSAARLIEVVGGRAWRLSGSRF
jgi:hypothetical protein